VPISEDWWTRNYPSRLVDEKNSYGVPAKPSGFPLYLFPLRSKRMPLQSLTREALQNLMAFPILINKVYFFGALTLTLTFSGPIRVIRVCKKSGPVGLLDSMAVGKGMFRSDRIAERRMRMSCQSRLIPCVVVIKTCFNAYRFLWVFYEFVIFFAV
jgi:hypothetical protein